MTLPGTGGTVNFQYDPFGRRIYKSSPAGTSIYVYDGNNVIQELGGAGNLLAGYTQGTGIDEPLAVYQGSTTSYFHVDGLGSITSLTNPAGGVADSFLYDSFGDVTASTGTVTNPFQYTGREFDSETGLYYYRARYYDPSIGRFLSEDPITFDGGGNFYTYVGNSPIRLVDPAGLAAQCKTPIYCDPGVLRAIQGAYMRAILANGGFTASSAYTQAEAGFVVNPTPSGGFQAGPIITGDKNGQLSIPVPTASGGATFHTHMAGSGMPSTPKNNVAGSSDQGDTLAAVQSGSDVYVISGSGLAVAPAVSTSPATGQGSHYVVQGKNFSDWFKALKRLCANLVTGN